MPWYTNIIPEYIKKSVCTCLIKRYLNNFIENEITRDQLNLDLFNGRGTAERISLAVEALNELGETQNWPIEFVDGYIGKIDINVPWTSILKDPSYVEICGLKLTVQPKQRKEDATSMFESMWNSMTSSMHLAEEFAKEEVANDKNTNSVEGVELFAQTIESIVGRIKIRFVDTCIQIEHLAKDAERGVGLILNIDLIEYFDECGNDPGPDEATEISKDNTKKAYLVPSFTTKKLCIEGVKLSSIEFPVFTKAADESELKTGDPKEHDIFFYTGVKNNLKTECLDSGPDESDEENLTIMFGKICNRQEVRIKLKQSENIAGPKVAIEVNLGAFILFLSPRQYYLLMALIDGFSSPSHGKSQKDKLNSKPMTDTDYEKIEKELQNLLNPFPHYQALNLQQNHGWATGAMDDSTGEYIPMKEAASGMYDSTLSGVSSSMESSFSSSMVSSATDQSHHSRRRVSNIDTDPTAEISRFHIRLVSLAVVLLHEDILSVSTDSKQVLVRQMQKTVEKFFNNIDYTTFSGYVGKDFNEMNSSFGKACRLSHLRLLAAPIQVEADEKTTNSSFSISGQMTAAKVQLLECLYNCEKVKYIPLIDFELSPNVSGSPNVTKPSIKLRFKHVQRTGKSMLSKKCGPRTDLSISLNKCSAEVDISIIDRITSLLNYPPIFASEKLDGYWNGNQTRPEGFMPLNSESILDLKIMSSLINLKLRFPVPDFRPPHDLSKYPWWERNIRKDYISLVLSDAIFQSAFHKNQTCGEYSVDCKTLDVYYYECDSSPGLHIGQAGQDDTYFSSKPNNMARPRLSIKVFPRKVDIQDDTEPDPMTHSCYGAFENQGRTEPGPFAAKRVVHESDTPHSKLHRDDSEELIIPGDRCELDNFMKSTATNSQIQVELLIPTVSLQFESKHIYELIYNRISNDLLLWEPAAPKPSSDLYKGTAYGNFDVLEFEDKFIMCKSGLQYESESDSSDVSDESDTNIFYSTYDKMKHSQKLAYNSSKSKYRSQSHIALTLKVVEGLVSLNPPVRDTVTNNVIPGQQGEFVLNVNNADIFIVNGYRGDNNLGYVCVRVGGAQLYHCDMQPVPSTSPPLRKVGSVIGRHLFPTIYQSGDETLINSTGRGGDREMFTVAIKIKANHETHHIKTVQVSLALNKATLRHRMCREPNTWISHLLDFFNVQDYPIAGYQPKDVLTELHLHLWDCAIDYRPLHLPVRSVVNIGSFSLSSHLTAASNFSTLRFIFEDCNLFISDKAPPKNGIPSSTKVDLAKDYVNVVKLGLFEISLKTTDKKVGVNPHIDFRASNNLLHIRTCSDSGRALMQLITYFANDGDLLPDLSKRESVSSSPKHVTDEDLINVKQDISLTKSQQDHISELLVDAMEDSNGTDESETSYNMAPTGTKVFYFPDEKDRILSKTQSKFLPQVTAELGDLKDYHFNVSSDTDDEFCIIGSEVGSEMFPKDGVSEIQWLTDEPVRVIENHFCSPIGKRDLLQPPKHFPTPVVRYTLCEMTVVWQMYGGNDFKEPDQENRKKEVRFSEKQLSHKVTFSNSKNQVSIDAETDKKLIGMHWMERGGENRDHNVLMELQLNKVRFQHERYPENTAQASRQVLLICDIEIRDRLKSSQINKFLYQYTSQARPKKYHSNMVVIKAVHIRPDPKLSTQECCLKISLLPIRLNIDQDSLLFFIKFFKELGGEASPLPAEPVAESSSKHSTPTHQPPVMTIAEENEEEIIHHAQKVVNENLILLMEESRLHRDLEGEANISEVNETDDAPIYFRKVVFSHDVFIRIDYHGKRVDMTHGPLAGLLMGLGQLNCSELKLKRIVHRHGLLGFSKLIHFLLQEWLSDIKRNQLSTILGGLGPMHALLQLFQGVRDLFWLPIEQYQKDGRIVRGLQRGANSFTTSTAMAALELTTRIIYLIQITAETAYDMLSPGPSIRTKRLAKQRGRKKRYHQPQDIREGLTNACMVVKEGIGETADNILQLAALEKEQKGYTGAVGAVIRQIPPTIFKPLVIASEATTNVLGGMQSQLVPDARKEANQKWRTHDL
ncbi:autophagy-related protein 2 homolog B isoform X2 [Cylas formicarius]|uniref:autophagy-related protein 2 homolog B isoform X2 n=1 Tax=Cylas formicarius TaxID=197179 RepID=UPI0029583EF2|nr:autophagy-related protein 2 homolog B isoform X2 [Cylas formicarius]